MKYSRFETLAMAVGSLSVTWTVLSTWRNGALVEELIAQALFLAVMVAAVHWGRKAGTVAALIAMAIYVAMRTPWLVHEHFSGDVVGLVLIRTITYGVVGIAGGALCSHIRYLLAGLDSNSNIDPATGVLHQRFITEVLRSMIGQHERYQKPFSVVVLWLADASAPAASHATPPAVLRKVAAQIRNDLRLVDDVAHLENGRFLLVLPYTAKAGAHVAANRVQGGVKRLLGEAGPTVCIEVLGIEDDAPAILALCGPSPATETSPGSSQAAA